MIKIKAMLSKEELTFCAILLWAIWFSRNKWVNCQEIIDANTTIAWANKYINELEESRLDLPENLRTSLERNAERPSTWVAPPANVYKLNVDAAIGIDSRAHGMGLIIRNENGLVMAAAAIHRRGSCTVAEAEAKAILEGVLFAYEQGFFDLVVESDSAIVIQMIKNGEADQIFSGVGLLIADILDLVPQFRKIDFGYVKRTCNGPAHDLAKHGLASRVDKFWMDETPQCISLDVITSVSSS